MNDKEQVELWKRVAKVFDDLLTQIRETAIEALGDESFREEALAKIVRLIGEPTHNDDVPKSRLDTSRGQK